MSSKGCTELQISASGAKNDEELAGDVRFVIAPQRIGKKCQKINFLIIKIRQKSFQRGKMKRRESSETRFRKFSWRTDVISMGKCMFEVSKKN